jgi:hypothetical protein
LWLRRRVFKDEQRKNISLVYCTFWEILKEKFIFQTISSSCGLEEEYLKINLKKKISLVCCTFWERLKENFIF